MLITGMGLSIPNLSHIRWGVLDATAAKSAPAFLRFNTDSLIISGSLLKSPFSHKAQQLSHINAVDYDFGVNVAT